MSDRDLYLDCCGWCRGQVEFKGQGCTCSWDHNADGVCQYAPAKSTPTTPRQSVLDEAGELIHSDRNVAYGPPMKNFERIADLWNTILGDQLKEPITTWQVADMSIAIKLARNIEKPKRDNYTDMAGYAACGWECAEGADCE